MIKSISFKQDFRSFKKAERFDFKPQVNILVGDQGSGKSTLIELIRSVMDPGKFTESDSSWRAKSIMVSQKPSELVELEMDPGTQCLAFDFERESPRDHSSILHDMFGEQMYGMKHSHGQSNLMILNTFLKKIVKSTAEVILMDEPDTAMSPRSCFALIQILQGLHLKFKKQVIVSAHNPLIIEGKTMMPKNEFNPYWTEVLSLEEKKWIDPKLFMINQFVNPTPKGT